MAKHYIKLNKVSKPSTEVTDYIIQYKIGTGFWETVQTGMIKSVALDLARAVRKEPKFANALFRLTRASTSLKKEIA